MYTYFIDNKLLNTLQSGFRSLHSTVTALLDQTNYWCLILIDRGMVNGVIFLDLKKAFDTVDHDLLLSKLAFHGLQSQTVDWFKSYLSNRQQLCYVNGVPSVKNTLTCGVPQGSILGPLLFLIYINDLPKCLDHSVARLYVDDTNLTFSGCYLSVLQNEMKNDLNKLFTWFCANKLTLNVLKTEFMLIGSRQNLAALEGEVILANDGMSLRKVSQTKCLGIQIDDREHLTWDAHVLSVRQKVTRNLDILKRNKPIINRENLSSLSFLSSISWTLLI